MESSQNHPTVLPDKLQEARKEAQLSTRAVAAQLPKSLKVSHATIANYERGRSSPGQDVLAALANLYKKPIAWFAAPSVALSGIRYRNLKSRVRVSDREWFEAAAHRWLQAYVSLERHLDRPLTKTVSIVLQSTWSDEDMAQELRSAFGFDNERPISSVIDCLERLGIRTIELPTDLAIDGLAAKFGAEYAVVLNSNTPNDRCRMDAAHEKWHILLGDCDCDGGESKAIENRAFRIGSLFLLPEAKLREAFHGRSLVKLVKFKEQYGISMAAMIYRAQESKLIKESEAKWLWREFSIRGWRKKEPGRVRPDRATRFEDMLDSAVRQKQLTWQKAESVTGVAESELRQRLKLAMGIKDTADEGGEEPPQILKVFA